MNRQNQSNQPASNQIANNQPAAGAVLNDEDAVKTLELFKIFIDALFDKAGLSKLSEDDRKVYRGRMLSMIEQRLFTACMAHLSGEALAELHEMTKDEDVMDIQKVSIFLSKKVPDFPKVLDQAMRDFEKDFLSGAAEINKAVEERK